MTTIMDLPVCYVPNPSLWSSSLTLVNDLHEANLETRTHVHGNFKVNTNIGREDEWVGV